MVRKVTKEFSNNNFKNIHIYTTKEQIYLTVIINKKRRWFNLKQETTIAQKILKFDEKLSKTLLDIPEGFKIINPYNNLKVKEITTKFYNKFYNDNNKRRIILGSSPARRGTALTGVPFEDAAHLQKETEIFIDNFYVNKSSSNFLYFSSPILWYGKNTKTSRVF